MLRNDAVNKRNVELKIKKITVLQRENFNFTDKFNVIFLIK